jgi:predicted Zn-dependent peptidase
MKKKALLFIALAAVCAGLAFGQAAHPRELTYPALKFQPPDPKAFRTGLAGGLRAYIQEDRDLPLFTITALVHFGDLYVPKEKAGLGNLLGETLIQGGTKTRTGPEIEERLDFLGGSLSFNVGERTSQLTLSVLSKDLDEGLKTFFDVLMNPEFREDAVKLARARLIEQLRQANDAPSMVLSREFEKLIYGDHPITRQPLKTTYEGITVADLKGFHDRYFFPKNIILAVSGDFSEAELKQKIDKAVAGWKNRSLSLPAMPKDFPKLEPGVYFIQKPINQGYISMGHIGLEDTNPDYFAVQVMNFILGGGSFSSRITKKVRSDEGLSYNQGSRFTYRWGFPGTFAGYVQTKSETVGYAISLVKKEFERIRTEPVSDPELETAVNYYLESFADFFQSPQVTMTNFANLEMTGKPMDYYKTYLAKIKAVTKEKVLEVAKKYIQPDKLAIMIVGDWEPCNKGGAKWQGPLEKLGKVTKLSLTDPYTGKVGN